jgi:hypothetical protein
MPDVALDGARSWTAVELALTAPLGFVLEDKDGSDVRSTWGSQAVWPALDPDRERAVLAALRREHPADDPYDLDGGLLGEAAERFEPAYYADALEADDEPF